MLGSDDLSYLLCHLQGWCHLKLYLGTSNCGSLVQISDNNTERKKSKVRKRAKIRNRYNQAAHLTQDNTGKVTTLQLDITSESQEVSPFPAGDHKVSINRRARKHTKNKTEIT